MEATGARTVNVNVEPRPGSLATEMSPPSMLASLGQGALSNLVAMLSMGALVLQAFDHPRRMHGRILQICLSRLDTHGGDDGVLAA